MSVRKFLSALALTLALAIPAAQANFIHGAAVSAPTHQVKWNPGQYMASNNVDGSPTSVGGSGANHAEIVALASAGSNVLGYEAIYYWGGHNLQMDLGPLTFTASLTGATSATLTSAIANLVYTVRTSDGSYRQMTVGSGAGGSTSTSVTWTGAVTASNTADFYWFGLPLADYADLQATAPGKRFSIMVWAEKFSGTGASGLGTPDYILNDPTDYGPGYDGIHGGYWALGSGSTQSGATAAIWRSSVAGRWEKFEQALANTPTGNGSYTFDTDPLVQDSFFQESSLSLLSGSDYSDSSFATQSEAIYSAMVAAFPHTNIPNQLNYTATQSTIAGIVANAEANRQAMSGPDVFPFYSTMATTYATWGQLSYVGYQWNGSAWVTGGTDYRPLMTYIGQIQEATYSYACNHGSTAPSDLLNSANYLGATELFWTYLTTEASGCTSYSTWPTVLSSINAHALTTTAYPANYP